ncbi:MAG: ornithine carbamoyltransferase [Deltaproteobacteria bacterium]|nr:ornithine carbamoyltransferase [Deltaproteobacteria bacterium]
MGKDFLTIQDLSREEMTALIDRALQIKKEGKRSTGALSGYTLGLIFDKASTRTRVSFETAMFRLGGQTLFLSRAQTQMSRDEAIEDTARVLSRYLDVLAIRTYSQEQVQEMAQWADIPVINALTDKYHPCQVLSDLMTVKEKRGALEDLRVAWIGDGNNVAQSWINAAHVLGFELLLACPAGYHPLPEVLGEKTENIRVVEDPKEAAEDADVINTDVWASMGQEDESARRLADFQGFQVNQSLVAVARQDVLVMHCLPAHRGEEITADVLDGPHSVVFDQAENKMHLHQALLEGLLLGRRSRI